MSWLNFNLTIANTSGEPLKARALGTVLDPFQVLSLILIPILQGRYYYHPQFAYAAVEDTAKVTVGGYNVTRPVLST